MKKHYAETGYLPITKFTPPSSETGYEDSDINNAIESDAWNKNETAIKDRLGDYSGTSLKDFLDDLAADKDNAELAQAIDRYLRLRSNAAAVAETDMLDHSNADDEGIPDDIYQSSKTRAGYEPYRGAHVDPDASVGPKNPPNEDAWVWKDSPVRPMNPRSLENPDFRPNL